MDVVVQSQIFLFSRMTTFLTYIFNHSNKKKHIFIFILGGTIVISTTYLLIMAQW